MRDKGNVSSFRDDIFQESQIVSHDGEEQKQDHLFENYQQTFSQTRRIQQCCSKWKYFIIFTIIATVCLARFKMLFYQVKVDHNDIDHTNISQIKQIPSVRYQEKEVQIPERKRPPNFIAPNITQSSPIVSIKKPERVDESACYNVDTLLKTVEKQVLAYSTQNLYICSNVNQRYEQYAQEPQNVFYFMTAYNFFLQVCHESDDSLIVNRANIIRWNGDRSVIEWALKFVRKGDQILLYQTQRYNLVEIILISKLIGSSGKLTVVGPFFQIKSFKKNIQLHQINNIHTQVQGVSQSQYESFNKIIGHSKQINLSQKTLSLVKNSKLSLLMMIDNVQQVRNLQKTVNVKYIYADNESCIDPIIASQIKDKGYYYISSKQPIQQQAIKATKEFQSVYMYPFYQNYARYKSDQLGNITHRLKILQQIKSGCKCIDRSRMNISQNYTISIYGNYLYQIDNIQMKNWESQRQSIQWVRQKIYKHQNIYYELSFFNLLAIVEIAQIVNQGKLYVYCIENQCSWIQRQKNFQNIGNIEIIRKSNYSLAVTADAIITDNETLIDKVIEANYLSKGKILGYFTRQRNTSFKVFGKLVPTHSMKQIKLRTKLQECYGFSYQNYFWDIDLLNRFYEIQPTLYQIFMYWGGSPYTLNQPRRNSFEQIILTSKVEVKIFNKDLFYMVQGIIPIHEAVQYLSAVHQSDYFRIYMMHNFGGGYSDVKHVHYDWRPYFKKLYDSPNKHSMGYYEKYNYYVACHDDLSPPPCSQIFSNYKKMIGNVAYIYKKNTIVTQQLIAYNHRNLDKKLPILKFHPASHSRDKKGKNFEGQNFPTTLYPIKWAQLGGQVMSRVAYKFPEYFLHDLPIGISSGYR